jgi:hypothetical protein
MAAAHRSIVIARHHSIPYIYDATNTTMNERTVSSGEVSPFVKTFPPAKVAFPYLLKARTHDPRR